MRKRLNWFLMLLCLLNIILLSTIAFKGRPVVAATKKVYKAEIVHTEAIQGTLDQRAAEGWQLVSASAYAPSSTASDLAVLIFEKQ